MTKVCSMAIGVQDVLKSKVNYIVFVIAGKQTLTFDVEQAYRVYEV